LPDELDDVALEPMLYPQAAARVSKAPTPDWAAVHVELKRPGGTRELLWQEYRARCTHFATITVHRDRSAIMETVERRASKWVGDYFAAGPDAALT
jgi:hypothetical protein